MVLTVLPDLKARLDPKEFREKLVRKARLAHKENKVFKVKLELLVQLALLEKLDLKEYKAKSVQKDHKAWPEQMVPTERPGPKEKLDPRESRVKLVHKEK